MDAEHRLGRARGAPRRGVATRPYSRQAARRRRRLHLRQQAGLQREYRCKWPCRRGFARRAHEQAEAPGAHRQGVDLRNSRSWPVQGRQVPGQRAGHTSAVHCSPWGPRYSLGVSQHARPKGQDPRATKPAGASGDDILLEALERGPRLQLRHQPRHLGMRHPRNARRPRLLPGELRHVRRSGLRVAARRADLLRRVCGVSWAVWRDGSALQAGACGAGRLLSWSSGRHGSAKRPTCTTARVLSGEEGGGDDGPPPGPHHHSTHASTPSL